MARDDRDDRRDQTNIAGIIVIGAAVLAAFGAVSSAICLRYERVGQNESAIETRNGVIVEDHLSPGLQWNWSLFDKVEFPRISHTTQLTTVTAVDRGQHCDADCVTLQTSDQNTVTGSLGIRWHIERATNGPQSVMYELYNVRGATTTTDMQEKFLVPNFVDCMIVEVNKSTATDLVEKGTEIKDSIKACTVPHVSPYHIVIDEVFDRGFGPSAEARQSMKRNADARQDGQIADIQKQTGPKRREAALINATIFAALYNQLVKDGIPPDQALAAACLIDTGSRDRPCIPYTATGAAGGPAFAPPPAAVAAGPQ